MNYGVKIYIKLYVHISRERREAGNGHIMYSFTPEALAKILVSTTGQIS